MHSIHKNKTQLNLQGIKSPYEVAYTHSDKLAEKLTSVSV